MHLSESRYAARRKDLLSLINMKELRQLGAQTDLDLPRIAVIGNQSAGKSSVVEAISGIKVPRGAGTCTRCPMECRLSSSTGPWTCQVSIRWEFDAYGEPLEKVDEIPFGKPITKKEDVELALRRAQTAVLNPHISAMYFLDLAETALSGIAVHDLNSLLFSKNVICVDLEGPDLTDLSFIDLPGIIQNAEPRTVALVEDLAVSHIQGNCLILVTLPVTDDIENQKALRLAQQVDPEGRRTIGVLTKPDLLSTGSIKSRDLWLDVIEGRRRPLNHGYYCTRQPDDDDRNRGITSADARAAEANYFRLTSPWSTTSEQDRLGTGNLVSTLSKLLVEIIDNNLPRLLTETVSQLEVCDRHLSSLPKVVEMDPLSHMLSLVNALVSEVNQHVHGGSGVERLTQDNHAAFALFKHAIRCTAPNFIPTLDSSDEIYTHDLKDEDDGDIDYESKPFYLKDMREHIQRSITRELPGKVPFEVNVTLIRAFQSTWEQSTNKCVDQVQDALLKTLLSCAKNIFQPYETLQNHLREFLLELMKHHRELCSHYLCVILESQRTPFTQNTHYLQASQDKWLAKYKDIRARGIKAAGPTAPAGNVYFKAHDADFKVHPAYRNQPENCPAECFKWGDGPFMKPAKETSLFSSDGLLAALAAQGFTGLTIEDLGKLNPPDEFETELLIMAEVRGYFQVAYEKIIDIIPELIDLTFVKAIANGLQSALYKKLGSGNADATARFALLLSENPEVAARRASLISQKRRLEKVRQELYDFGL